MTRLIALDVDGTLLDPGGALPPARQDVLAHLQAHGIRVVLATGKIWPSIGRLVDKLSLPGPHVCCNGAAVVEGHQPVQVTPMESDLVETLTSELADREVAHACYLADGSIVTNAWHPDLEAVVRLGEPRPELEPVDGRAILKVLAVMTEDEEGDARAIVAGQATIQRTGADFLEWQAPGVSKGQGLEYVRRALGVGWEDIIAVGDAENDIPMLRRAGLGVAVGHADPSVAQAADLHLTEHDLTVFLEGVAAAVVPSGANRS